MPHVHLYGAGPPCQPVSSAGKKKGKVTCPHQWQRIEHWPKTPKKPNHSVSQADLRARCYSATFRYIDQKRPDAVLLEQVPNILRSKKLKKNIFDRWIMKLLGIHSSSVFNWCCCWNWLQPRLSMMKDPDGERTYNVYYKILDASEYGLPQQSGSSSLPSRSRKRKVQSIGLCHARGRCLWARCWKRKSMLRNDSQLQLHTWLVRFLLSMSSSPRTTVTPFPEDAPPGAPADS